MHSGLCELFQGQPRGAPALQQAERGSKCALYASKYHKLTGTLATFSSTRFKSVCLCLKSVKANEVPFKQVLSEYRAILRSTKIGRSKAGKENQHGPSGWLQKSQVP